MTCEEKVEHHDMDIAAIVAAMEDAEIVEDMDGGFKKSLYIGSVFSLTPSGKYYMPWATSNLEPCPVCLGKGKLDNPHHLPKLYARSSEIVDGILEKDMVEAGGYHNLPEEVRNKLDRLRATMKRTLPLMPCSRCDGIGCAEAADDEVWYETFEEDLSEHGLYLESGEGDPCDLFVSMVVEASDVESEEVLCD